MEFLKVERAPKLCKFHWSGCISSFAAFISLPDMGPMGCVFTGSDLPGAKT